MEEDCCKISSWNSDARRLEPSRALLDEANRRSTAGGRAEEIQRGWRKPSSKPRGLTMQSADRRRCNRREIPTNVARDGELEKMGVRRGESRNGCLPPAGKFVRGEKRCIAYRVHQRFCMPIDTQLYCTGCRKYLSCNFFHHDIAAMMWMPDNRFTGKKAHD